MATEQKMTWSQKLRTAEFAPGERPRLLRSGATKETAKQNLSEASTAVQEAAAQASEATQDAMQQTQQTMADAVVETKACGWTTAVGPWPAAVDLSST
eukprot:Skav231397  [mRNA]  locus=scaffold1456:126105:133587:- [translate_table: standard]